MGVEAVRTYSKSGNMDKLSTPPGFVSQTSFVLRKVSHKKESSNRSGSRRPSGSELGQDEITVSDMADVESFKRSLWNRSWILHDQTTLSSDASNSLKREEVPARRFPKVEKVEVIEEAPVFHPTEEEFSDMLAYIASLRDRAEPHGICCVVPPPSWKPRCHLEDKKIWEDSAFPTQVQLFGGTQTENPRIKKEDNGDAKNGALSKRVQFCRIDLGPKYTLDKFKNFADTYKKQHFSMKAVVSSIKKSSSPLKPEELAVAVIEQEYLQLVESPTVELGVLYGNDLDTSVFGSGFTSSGPSESCKHSESGWNLNNTAMLPGSLLSFGDCKSVCVPRLCIGMCFSSQLWKVEKDRLYSLCYLHLGAPRVWYAVPGHCSSRFKATRQSIIEGFSEGEPDTHRESVITMSPYVLSSEGIPVTRCVQSPGQFVIIFPGSYYSGFDTGFNCLEKVNFAPVDWLPHGDTAVMLNQEKMKKSAISYDKLLFGAAREAVRCQCNFLLLGENTPDSMRWKDACGTNGILYKVLKSRVRQERNRMEYLTNQLQSQKMDKDYDAVSKRECCVCFGDLHLSAVQCSCSVDRYACLIHMKQLCPCADKIILYRYSIDDLNALVEALGGKYSSMYRWARQYLNFSLYSSLSSGFPTSTPETKQRDKKPDETHQGAIPSDTRRNAAGSSKTQVKAREKLRSLEQIMKVKEDKGVSPAESGGKTSEKLLLKREMASDRVMVTSSSSESDYANDPRVKGKSSQLKGCKSGKKNGVGSSNPEPLEDSSPTKSTRSSNSSATNKRKKQRQR